VDLKNTGSREAAEQYYGMAGREYFYLERTLANVFAVFRMSMGDHDFAWFGTLEEGMGMGTACIFYMTWFTIAMLTSVIFLNFIIAEASESYNKVNANTHNILTHGKVVLINETEEMIGSAVLKGKDHFPRYIIARKVDN